MNKSRNAVKKSGQDSPLVIHPAGIALSLLMGGFPQGFWHTGFSLALMESPN